MSGWDLHHLMEMEGLLDSIWNIVLKRGWLGLAPMAETEVIELIVVTALRQSDHMVAVRLVECRRCRADAMAKSSIWYGLLV